MEFSALVELPKIREEIIIINIVPWRGGLLMSSGAPLSISLTTDQDVFLRDVPLYEKKKSNHASEKVSGPQ